MELASITGFATFDPCVEIFDARGKVFLYFENTNEKRYTFNLPAGEYIVVNDIYQLKTPLVYECPALPKKQKSIVAKDLTIIVGNNPHKASYKNEIGEMFIDEEIWNKTIPERRFVMGHELGHCYYYDEWKCDVFSAKTMLDEGFNPSQCFYANSFCLSDKGSSRKRKDILYKFLKQTKCYDNNE